MKKLISKDELVSDLRRVGVEPGSILYVRAKSSAVGSTPSKTTFFEALLEAVGPEGTLILPAFTSYGKRWARTPTVFTPQTPASSGALSHPKALRSTHPTHSFVAIGPEAAWLLSGHDHTKPAFYPVARMIERQTMMTIIGCDAESPGFSTVHYAQEKMGLSQQHLQRYLYQVSIPLQDDANRENKAVLWRPSEVPGCSMGFRNLYPHYIRRQAIQITRIGQAYSIFGNASDLFEADQEALHANARVALCTNPTCVSCRVLRLYNMGDAPMALARIATRRLWRYSGAK
jgi:aminoglycoside 3-N-acetyltransferase